MNTLVTGGTGFIGSYLISRLRERGDDVRCVAKDALNVEFLRSLDVEIVMADLMNGVGWGKILQDIDLVFHVAGVTRARSTQEYYDGNYRATRKVVEMVRRYCHQLRRFVYVSSLSAVGPSLDGTPLSEDAVYHPVSAYGRSKMMGEVAVHEAMQDLPATIVRPSVVYGPRERDLYDYIKMVQRGIHAVIGFDKKLVNMVYVDDLVEGLLLASEHPATVGQTYHLGGAEQTLTEEIGSAIAKALHCSPLKIRIPESFVYGVAAVRELLGKLTNTPVFLNLQKARETVQRAWICSIKKARTDFGYCPRVALDEGIDRTLQWHYAHGWL